MRDLKLNSPRIRFNFGFHDGAVAGQYLHNHFDKAYLAGHQAGFEARRDYTVNTTSDAAWRARKR